MNLELNLRKMYQGSSDINSGINKSSKLGYNKSISWVTKTF